MHRFCQLWIALTSSLWFLPSTMVAVAVISGIGLTALDVAIGSEWTARFHLVFGIGADGARGMLGAIAGSMMTVASLTFSLTISTLATASSQYTSRLIRNFMRDHVNQFVLGYFVGLFAYCLVVLRTIRGGDEGQFVPALAVMVGLLLALVSIGVLIYFIHHTADSIQASTILERVTLGTVSAIDDLFPADIAEPVSAELTDEQVKAVTDETSPERHTITTGKFGYAQSIDSEAMLEIAAECDAIIHIVMDVGTFVTPGAEVCYLVCANAPDEQVIDRVRSAFSIGSARTIEQDAAFGIRQIVDIALKALSPGVNDSTTAVMCVEHLGVVLERLAARQIPDRVRGEDGTVRIVASGRSFDSLVRQCLDQVRQYASANPAVLKVMFDAIALAGRQTHNTARRQLLAQHAERTQHVVERTVESRTDIERLFALASKTITRLNQPLKKMPVVQSPSA